MNPTNDPIELLKKSLEPFLTSDWTPISTEDETGLWQECNCNPKQDTQITSADSIIWSANGKFGTLFQIAEVDCDAKIQDSEILIRLPTEYFATLQISLAEAKGRKEPFTSKEHIYLRIEWSGFENLTLDEIEISTRLKRPDESIVLFLGEIITKLSQT